MCALHMAPMAPSMPQKEASIDRVHTFTAAVHTLGSMLLGSAGALLLLLLLSRLHCLKISQCAGAKQSHRR